MKTRILKIKEKIVTENSIDKIIKNNPRLILIRIKHKKHFTILLKEPIYNLLRELFGVKVSAMLNPPKGYVVFACSPQYNEILKVFISLIHSKKIIVKIISRFTYSTTVDNDYQIKEVIDEFGSPSLLKVSCKEYTYLLIHNELYRVASEKKLENSKFIDYVLSNERMDNSYKDYIVCDFKDEFCDLVVNCE